MCPPDCWNADDLLGKGPHSYVIADSQLIVENTTARDGHIKSLSSSGFLHFSFIQSEPNVRTEEKLQVLSRNREQKKGSTLFTTLEKNYKCEEMPDDVRTKNLCEERLKGNKQEKTSINKVCNMVWKSRFAWKTGQHQMGFFFQRQR